MRWKWMTRLEKIAAHKIKKESWRRVFALTPQYDLRTRTAYWWEWVWIRRYAKDDDDMSPWITEVRGGHEKPENGPLPSKDERQATYFLTYDKDEGWI